jgi:molybdenum ABC transporter, periplasmic molybdate-binding protein
MVRAIRLMAAAFIAVMLSAGAMAADVTFFAAASLSNALPEIAAAYKQQTGKTIKFSFAASSVLARQIEASPGVDLFMSADADWMDYLDNRGLIDHATRKTLLSTHLVLIAPVASTVTLKLGPHVDLVGALKGGRLAIADPDSVPAGKYGKSALTSLGIWNSLVDHTANAESVRVALAYVARGETPLGIVYATDAKIEPKVKVIDTFPDKTHAPIVYPAAMTKDAKPEAKGFLDFLSGPQARAVFVKYGFELRG